MCNCENKYVAIILHTNNVELIVEVMSRLPEPLERLEAVMEKDFSSNRVGLFCGNQLAEVCELSYIAFPVCDGIVVPECFMQTVVRLP